jgi:hypothetical protein
VVELLVEVVVGSYVVEVVAVVVVRVWMDELEVVLGKSHKTEVPDVLVAVFVNEHGGKTIYWK